MENCVFKTVPLEDNTLIRLHITLEENSVKLILLQHENAWKAHETSKNLNKFATQHKLNLEEYYTKLLEYIKTPSSDVIFILNETEFVISRLFNSKLKVKYFSCKLQKVNYVEHVEQIMDNFYSMNCKYLEQANSAIKAKNEIEANKTSCELALKELIEKKKADEEELFGRFVLVLNEKKRRIQHLTELLEAFRQGRPTTNPPIQVKSRKKKGKKEAVSVKKLETVSESEPSESSNSNTNTDDEDTNSLAETASVDDTSGPSTSMYSFLQDDEDTKSVVLPKRLKTEKSSNDLVAPSTSKAPEKVVVEEPKGGKRSGSPGIDISTQQLLDLL